MPVASSQVSGPSDWARRRWALCPTAACMRGWHCPGFHGVRVGVRPHHVGSRGRGHGCVECAWPWEQCPRGGPQYGSVERLNGALQGHLRDHGHPDVAADLRSQKHWPGSWPQCSIGGPHGHGHDCAASCVPDVVGTCGRDAARAHESTAHGHQETVTCALSGEQWPTVHLLLLQRQCPNWPPAHRAAA